MKPPEVRQEPVVQMIDLRHLPLASQLECSRLRLGPPLHPRCLTTQISLDCVVS